MEVRPAVESDVAQICQVVRASITELCVADHGGDANVLTCWLENKTPQNVSRWLANTNNVSLVAAEGGGILAAGCITASGEIILNYVSPAARFRGVSSILLSRLEATAREKGNRRCTLESTRTAHRFYEERGYEKAGASGEKHGLTTFPMAKAL